MPLSRKKLGVEGEVKKRKKKKIFGKKRKEEHKKRRKSIYIYIKNAEEKSCKITRGKI